ncbi:hypothetical protein AU476_26240 [Cupriavidus sp. UYMSc13B]|nr:hypothetical protein AU476_26240 [Cupriavidus sp. UYMSc13B]
MNCKAYLSASRAEELRSACAAATMRTMPDGSLASQRRLIQFRRRHQRIVNGHHLRVPHPSAVSG